MKPLPYRSDVPLKPARSVTLEPIRRSMIEARWGSYTTARRLDGTRSLAVVICGDCGRWIGCSGHRVTAGRVHPSIGCPMCGWHVWAELAGWGRR